MSQLLIWLQPGAHLARYGAIQWQRIAEPATDMTEKTAKGNPLSRDERLQIMLEAAELAAVDDFRFGNRLPSRAAAVRELLRRGLVAEGFTIDQPRAPSKSFGVLDDTDQGGSDSTA